MKKLQDGPVGIFEGGGVGEFDGSVVTGETVGERDGESVGDAETQVASIWKFPSYFTAHSAGGLHLFAFTLTVWGGLC